ncbi:MAG: LamG-like jellyroll fold domain-containing protein, partial [Actinomycetota bacterium]|nr:LamG-like jellyroll fold domain-containing protein [Actinomycetota bacterium]
DDVDLWLNAPRLSIAAWVRPDALPEAGGDPSTAATIITVGDWGRLNASHRDGEGWDFTLKDVDHLTEGDEIYVATTGDHASYTTGRWTHLVGTYDGDWLRLYVDGDEVAQAQVGLIEPVNKTAIEHSITASGNAIGTGSATQSWFTGAIDEVSLWDEALGPDDVKALYNGGAPIPATALNNVPNCGDGLLQAGEQCDDGNDISGDGCEPGCSRCGNGALDSHLGETCDDANHVAGDGCAVDCTLESAELFPDCAELRLKVPGAASGHYDIYPDGTEGSKVTAWCNMDYDGGGWTRIFIAQSADENALDLGYTLEDPALRGADYETLIGFMPFSGGPLVDTAQFITPDNWVDKTPMAYEAVDE